MKHQTRKLLSLVLAVCMLLSLAAPAAAVPAGKVTFTKIDNSAVTADLMTKAADDLHTMEDHLPNEMVRVSIVLEEKSTIQAGFSVESIAANSQAMAYRAELKNEQAKITNAIEKTIGGKLDVVWNLTLAANIISANVKFGQIEKIKAVDGVAKVLIETSYEPDVVEAAQVSDPNMATSSKQIGSAAAWAAGYTGAGSRIAIIDTGSDIDHQSLNAEAFEYSLSVLAEQAGVSYEDYIASLDLLDAEEIASVADQLNAPVAEKGYVNTKNPFGYNYIDKNLDIVHKNDGQGTHGSHVAGIATANAYIKTDDGFVPALSYAKVQGVAPDAQLITMKVFGKAGGAYPSDYMVAIEDAIILGCDACNLSLGSGNPGMSRDTTEEYQAVMDSLTEAGMVVAMSAGNSGYWAESAANLGLLYAEDISMQTDGSPGSYTNSLAVASVENDGKTGFAFYVGDLMVVYNEMLEGSTGSYTNKPFTTIAGEHEYVFIDGMGTAADWAAVGDALEGKIALCSRGEISFFEKAQFAVEAGAIATFIYNNQAGVINMDLSDYKYTQPCASLLQADGAAVKAASTPVTDDAGNVLYYTGTMTIGSELEAGQFDSDFYTMSTFSSWGIPGSLEMKPEITAPGGNIYSINGLHVESGKVGGGPDQYVNMSGTSMASPQVAGMAAIVAQYIRENDLEAQTGLSARQLAQSLLMSTAEPMLADASSYHSILQQGAGLANVGAAVSADSYIMMADGSNAGAADGKVKVELGDDPAREGSYTATFTINNLTDVEKTYDLGANFFIQAPYAGGADVYMHTATALIGMDTEWIVNGLTVEPTGAYTGLDFNADGTVNSDDGQAILDYATGVVDTLKNLKKADLDADGDVDSYDAYLFLKNINSAVTVVPAGGSAEVTVNFTMSNMWKDVIDYYFPNGTYIQGYLFAEGVSSDEGVAGTCHSIPVLGFYGSWSEASMFDVGTYAEYAAGDETRIPYLNNPEANSLLITYANEPGSKYYFGGNPMIADDTYMPERDAINSADIIAGVKFTAIRNAAASKFEIINETTGEILAQAFPGAVSSAYYYVNGQTWKNTTYTLSAQGKLNSASEGDIVSIGLTLAPEYYVDDEGNVDWDALENGATLGGTAVIDNTAPEIEDIVMSLMGNGLTVTASDNNYIAAVVLYNKAGTEVLAYTGAKQDIALGESAEYKLSLEDVKGTKFMLQIMDYAMNTTSYVVELGDSGDNEMPDMIAFDLNKNFWTSFSTASTNKDIVRYASSEYSITAATIVDKMVLAADEEGNLLVMPQSDLTDVTVIADTGTTLLDVAYNPADDTVYAVDEYGQLVTVDRLTAKTEVVGEIGVATNTLACDENGTFYCNGFGTGAIYSFTLDTLDAPETVVADVGIKSQYLQSMEIDPNTGKLMWISFSVKKVLNKTLAYAYLYEIDTAAGTYKRYNDLYDEICALIIPVKGEGGSWTAPTDVITDMQISAESASMLKGGSLELTASVLPWTVVDRTVTWTSDNEAVATVDENGVVTAVTAGTAVITATSNLDDSFSASCEITVTAMEITINGTLQDAEGNPMLYSWNMAETDSWDGGIALDTSMTSATYNTASGKYYIMDAVADSWSMHVVDPATGKSETVGTNAIGLPLWDMEYSEYYSTEDAPKVNAIYYYYLLAVKDPMALDTAAFGLSSFLANYTGGSYLTAITSGGYEQITSQGVTYDSERLLILDNAGYIWSFWIYPSASGYGASINFYPTDLDLAFPGNEDDMYCSMVVGEDGNLYLSAFDGTTNELYCLTYDEVDESYSSTYIGNFGADVWPATITSVTSNAAEGNGLPAYESIATIYTEPVSAEELAAASQFNTAATFTMDAAAREQKELESIKPVIPEDDETEESTVTFEITADKFVNNGIVDIYWDADDMELLSINSTVQFTSQLISDETAAFGYVDLSGIEAGEVIATLAFDAKSNDFSSLFVIDREMNDSLNIEPVVIATGWSGYTNWELTSDGTLTFTPTEQTLNGQTNMKNYWKVGGKLVLPWSDYSKIITKVVIEEGIHDIGQMAFYELPNLTEVVLPESAVEIRHYAFKNCKNLTTINLEVVENICEGAFFGCSALENVTFAEEVTIGDWAFSKTPYVEMNP